MKILFKIFLFLGLIVTALFGTLMINAQNANFVNFTPRTPQTDMGLIQQSNSNTAWLQDAKFGMFIHWGVYSGPGQGEWYMHDSAVAPSNYAKFAQPSSGNNYFQADQYDPNAWAQLALDAGMKYVTLTTRHHDGYALFPSQHPSAWTSMQTHGKDFIDSFVTAVRNKDLKVGLYYSPINWQFPGYYDVYGTGCKSNPWNYITDIAHKENARIMKNLVYEQVKYIVTKYGRIDQLWWDGGWISEQGSDRDGAFFWEPGQYRSSTNQWPVDSIYSDSDASGQPLGLMGIVRKYQPNIIATTRSGWMGDFINEEGGSPTVTGPIRGADNGQVYERNVTMSNKWGYVNNSSYMDYRTVIRLLSDSVVHNMSLMLNVSPDRHGVIPIQEQDVLRRVGVFLSKVGESVYNTRGGPWQPVDGQYGFTKNGNKIYIHILPNYSGTTITTPAFGNNNVVTGVYNVYDKTSLSFVKNSDTSITISGLNRTQHSDDTVVGITLNEAIDTPNNTPTTTIPTNTLTTTIPTSTATVPPTDQNNSYIKLCNISTGLYIDGMGSSSNGSAACQWGNSNSNNQQWTIINSGNYVMIKNRATGLYLDGMGRTSNGEVCGQWNESGSANQQWIKEMMGANVRFKNRATGLYLDGMGTTSNGSNLCQWENSGSTNQQWQIQ